MAHAKICHNNILPKHSIIKTNNTLSCHKWHMPKPITTIYYQTITTFSPGIHCFLYATLITSLQPKEKTLFDKRQTNTSSNLNIKH